MWHRDALFGADKVQAKPCGSFHVKRVPQWALGSESH